MADLRALWRGIAGAPAGIVMQGNAVPDSARSDLRIVVYAVSGMFGALGMRLGASGALVGMIGTGAAYALVPWRWDTIASVVNRAHGSAAGPLARLGADATKPLIAATADPGAWQIAALLAIVLAAFGLGALVSSRRGPVAAGRLPGLVDRLMGGFFGCVAGYLVARFALLRLLPGALVSPFQSGGGDGNLGAVGALFVVILVFALYGILSLGGRKRQVYEG